MAWNTGLVRITGSTIASADRVSDVIPGSWRVTCLTMSTYIDQQLSGHGYPAKMNYQVIRVLDGQVFDNWYQWNADDLIGDWSEWLVDIALNFGIESGGGGWAQQNKRGMYIFRPIVIVDTSKYGQSLYQPQGTSQFAVGDDHYFWCE